MTFGRKAKEKNKVNSCSFMGRAGRDPESRFIDTAGGTISICETTMAVYRSAKNKEDQTLWVKIKAFGKSAEALQQYVRKGDQFAITGRMDCEKWTDQQGNKRETWIAVADRVHLCASKEKAGTSARPEKTPANKPDTKDLDAIFGSDEELPF